MMLVAHPLLVIGVPCFNEAEFLERTLRSLADQAWWDFAVLISDNASTDDTGRIARAFCKRDSRFHYHAQSSNIGSGRNFNFVLEHTASPYILLMGAHDLIEPDMVERHIRLLERRPEVSVSQSAHAWIDTEDRFVERVDDGDLDGGGADDPDRYLRSIGQNRNNVGVNSVIRRAMLDGVRFTDVVGTDRIMLSHLAFRGPFATDPDILYKRRTFATRIGNNPYMERLTGRANATEDWSAFAQDYDRDLAGLLDDRANSRRLRRALALRLRYHLPVKRSSLLTRALWTVRRVRKWSGKIGGMVRGHA
jgi:glycosyltransferase involved in cell wall biosynthesis